MSKSLLKNFKEKAILSNKTISKINGGSAELDPIYRIDGDFVYTYTHGQ
ncbi:hypothetical protein [uncultured Lacinutrix sp.]|nr:hypothetical protein [uncultured Lacinutrix sp.]